MQLSQTKQENIPTKHIRRIYDSCIDNIIKQMQSSQTKQENIPNTKHIRRIYDSCIDNIDMTVLLTVLSYIQGKPKKYNDKPYIVVWVAYVTI